MVKTPNIGALGIPPSFYKKNVAEIIKKSKLTLSGLYPAQLGMMQKNNLKSKGNNIEMGRWININHMDWSNPKWALASRCWGWVIDRAIGGKKYTRFDSDYAIMTLYFDPVEEMPIYDMLPINSPLFDVAEEPKGSLEDLYGFATVEGIGDIDFIQMRPIAPIPLLGSIVALLLILPMVVAKPNQ